MILFFTAELPECFYLSIIYIFISLHNFKLVEGRIPVELCICYKLIFTFQTVIVKIKNQMIEKKIIKNIENKVKKENSMWFCFILMFPQTVDVYLKSISKFRFLRLS